MGLAICFFGADGSGKTTLARCLATYFRRGGSDVCVAWLRGTHTLASILARFLRRFSAFRGYCNPYYGICIPSSMRLLWAWLEFISVIPVIITRFLIPRLVGRVVVGERSPIDFLVWLVLTLRWVGVLRSFIARAVLALSASICSYAIYVRAEEGELVARRRGFAEERLIPLELRVYDAIARALKFPCVDTTGRSVSASFAEVLKVVSYGRG